MVFLNFIKKNKIFFASTVYLIITFLLLIFNNRSHYIFLTDIEAAYYMSAFLTMNNELPVFYFHPATLFQYITGFLLKILNFDSLDQIPQSLNFLRILAISFNFFSILVFLKTFKKFHLKNGYKILIISVLYPATLFYVTYFGVNSITFGLTLLLSSYYVKNYFNNFSSLLSLSVISGICLNSKLIFLPCLIIIFINIFFNGDRFLSIQNIKKAILYTILTSFIFFLVGFKMIHTYPEILIKIFVRPEGNVGIYNYFFILIITIILNYYFVNSDKSINYKIKNFFLIFFLIYFSFNIIKYLSIDYLPSFFRYQAAFFIFSLIIINLNFKLKSKYLNIFIIFTLIIFTTTHLRAYYNTVLQKNISYSYQKFIEKKILDNYFVYFWTGSGDHSFDSQNFIEWADLRYGNSFLKKNKLTNFKNKQIYNIRLDIKNYEISQNLERTDNLKNKIKSLLIKYKIFPDTKYEKNFYNIDVNKKNKCLLLIFNKFEFDNEINNMKSNELFTEKPILFLEMITKKKLIQKNIYLDKGKFIIFLENDNQCSNNS